MKLTVVLTDVGGGGNVVLDWVVSLMRLYDKGYKGGRGEMIFDRMTEESREFWRCPLVLLFPPYSILTNNVYLDQIGSRRRTPLPIRPIVEQEQREKNSPL
jgi:hypothetical protein